MFKNMDSLYSGLAEFYAFDKQKYPLDEFFGDIKTFKDAFQVKIIFNEANMACSGKYGLI